MGNTQASCSSATAEASATSADELQTKIFLALNTIAESSKILKNRYAEDADPRVLDFIDDIGAHLPKSITALEYARLRIHQNLVPSSDSNVLKDMPVVVQYVDSKGPGEAPITVDTDKTASAFVVPQLATDTPTPPLEGDEVCTLTFTVDLNAEEYDERPLYFTFKAEPLADGRLPIPPFSWVVDANLRQFLIERDQIQREQREMANKKGKGKQREVPEVSTGSHATLPVTILVIKPSTPPPATNDAPVTLPAPGPSDESTVPSTGGLKFKYSVSEQSYPKFASRRRARDGPLSIEDVIPINEGYELIDTYQHSEHGLVFMYELKEWPIVLENGKVDSATAVVAAKQPAKKVAKQVKPVQRQNVEPPAKQPPAKAAPRPSQTIRVKVAPATAVPVRRSSRLNTSKPLPTAGPSSSKGAKKAAETQKPAETKKAATAKKVTNTKKTVDSKKAVDAKKTAEVKDTRKRKAEENEDDDAQVDTTDKSVIAPKKKARRAPVTKTAAAEETDDAEKIPAAKKVRAARRK
ncbi:hypothetical protein EYR36_001987 [Pleurotus pulmonarius]|nr:hypothetical protein EYR36_001987 [Pleurotus pulmonarius]KAF4588263.1 hypothetical protein EYR38_010230 [Pleurotus pulmonarius]